MRTIGEWQHFMVVKGVEKGVPILEDGGCKTNECPEGSAMSM